MNSNVDFSWNCSHINSGYGKLQLMYEDSYHFSISAIHRDSCKHDLQNIDKEYMTQPSENKLETYSNDLFLRSQFPTATSTKPNLPTGYTQCKHKRKPWLIAGDATLTQRRLCLWKVTRSPWKPGSKKQQRPQLQPQRQSKYRLHLQRSPSPHCGSVAQVQNVIQERRLSIRSQLWHK